MKYVENNYEAFLRKNAKKHPLFNVITFYCVLGLMLYFFLFNEVEMLVYEGIKQEEKISLLIPVDEVKNFKAYKKIYCNNKEEELKITLGETIIYLNKNYQYVFLQTDNYLDNEVVKIKIEFEATTSFKKILRKVGL